MPAASRTAFQRLNSRAMCWPNASAVEPRTTTPAVVKRFCTASSLRLSLMTVLSLAMISGAARREHAVPRRDVVAGKHARFDRGRHVRHRRKAVLAGDRERLELA